MSHPDVVADGQPPVRHHTLAKWLGTAVVGSLAVLLVFASGYLVGSDAQPAAAESQPSQPSQQPAPALPAAKSLRRSEPDEKAPEKPQTRRVTVESGQSLWQIAATYVPGKNPQTVVNEIIRLNSLDNPSAIEIGQKILVPRYQGVQPQPEVLKTLKTEPVKAGEGSAAIPTELIVPTLGLREGLINLDVVGGALQVPQRWNDVGWWQSGPRPGEGGAAVFVGHVDSPTGPAVFYGISSLREGDLIRVDRADATTATFKVFSSVLYPREEFPSKRVYRQGGPPVLNLVTCGGSYDAEAGQYTENLVVSARLVTKARG